jgi:hypothetical protein
MANSNDLVWTEWLIVAARFGEFATASSVADARLMECFSLSSKEKESAQTWRHSQNVLLHFEESISTAFVRLSTKR